MSQFLIGKVVPQQNLSEITVICDYEGDFRWLAPKSSQFLIGKVLLSALQETDEDLKIQGLNSL